MEVENHPTLEELANGNKHENGGAKEDSAAAGDNVDGTSMPAPAGLLLSGTDDQRLKKKARRLLRTSSRDGSLVIPGQATAAFIAPHRR